MNKKPLIKQSYYKHHRFSYQSKAVVVSQVKEIISVVQKNSPKSLKKMVVLDVGCGCGEYSFEIEKYVKKVVGVEPYKYVYMKAVKKKNRIGSRVELHNCLIEDFKTKLKFDLVMCLTVLEHMPDAEKSFGNIFDLMRKGGIIYLTAPNKWWPSEQHYRLPFLSWLPLPLSNYYLRIARRGMSYEDCAYSKSYFGIQKFFNKYPCKFNFLLPENPDAEFLGSGEKGFFQVLIRKVGIKMIRKMPFFWVISRGFILLIQKC